MSDAIRDELAAHLARKGSAVDRGEGCPILLCLDVLCVVVALGGDVRGVGEIVVTGPAPEELERLRRAASKPSA